MSILAMLDIQCMETFSNFDIIFSGIVSTNLGIVYCGECDAVMEFGIDLLLSRCLVS